MKAADPQIVNGSSSWPSRSRSAPAGSVAEEEGRGATKTSPVSCGVAADGIDYLSSTVVKPKAPPLLSNGPPVPSITRRLSTVALRGFSFLHPPTK